MIQNSIKAITSLIGKPLTDFNESDIMKITESDRKDLLLNTQVLEYLIENTNEDFASIVTPLYALITYKETMDDVEQQLQIYKLNEDTYSEELKIQMQSRFESENIMQIIASAFVLLTMYPDVELDKDKIKLALLGIENLVSTLPLPSAIDLFESLITNLYFPMVNTWYDMKKEILVEENESFRTALLEYTKILEEREETDGIK